MTAENAPSLTSRTAPAAVRLVSICKRFGAVQANREVSVTVASGTIHALVGENGAGKSTLMSILYGFYAADSGQIEVQGQTVKIRHSDEAIALGIGMVHQHFMLVDTLTALDNVLLGIEPHFDLRRSQRVARKKLTALMTDTGLQVNLDSLVQDLSVGDRQRLEILKALYRGARILILDEPTAVLTVHETEQLFEVLRRLRAQGKTILLITHKLKEVLALCDQVTVMRQGAVVHECSVHNTSLESLAQAMVGRKINTGVQRAAPVTVEAAILLRAQHLSLHDHYGVARLRDVSITLRAGEITGVAGVAGNGQSELLDALSGLRTPERGTLQILEQTFDTGRWLSPAKARQLGMAHVPEDRHERGLVMSFEAWESAALGYGHLPEFSRGIWMKIRSMMSNTAGIMQRFDVRPPQCTLSSSKFSGGNQQKLILAREFNQSPRILLVGQPTRGVDIGAIEFIHGQLRALRDAGCAVLVVSSELDEILALSDRVVVMNQGRITGELPVHECTEKKLGMLMASDTTNPQQAVAQEAVAA